MAGKRSHAADLLGVSRLAVDAVAGVTGLVEAVHMTVLGKAAGTPAVRPIAGVTALAYRAVKGVTRLVGGGLDAVLGRLAPLLGEQSGWAGRDALLAAVNGVLGDRLAATGNPLAIPMTLRPDADSPPCGRILVLAHGLCMNGQQWEHQGFEGYTVLRLDYNSGRHISVNGREFAERLQEVADGWPVPVEAIAIVGHSMGGLVARSACHYAAQAGHSWLAQLRTMVFLGSPHHGAPLERGGNWLQLLTGLNAYSAPFARLAKIRSAGITDLRHGSLLDDDWRGKDRFARDDLPQALPLPAAVQCCALAACIGKDDEIAGRLAGDGLVPVASALGRYDDPARALRFSREAVIHETNHMDLLSSLQVRRQLLDWL
jgi:pimeloyl-ACP methyl ester carboxylesterase